MITTVLAAEAAQQGSGMGMLIMMVAIFAIMYFFMIRPQQKQQKIREFQNALKEGDNVMVGGGIHATVRRVDLTAGTVDVEIARGVVVTVDKAGVFADGTQQPQK